MNNISKCHQFLVHGTDLTGLPLLSEIKKIAVVTRSNLVNVVSLMSAAQEHGVQPFQHIPINELSNYLNDL